MKVNSEMLRYYWELGRDIVTKQAESKWGSGFMKNFYLMYRPYLENVPKIGEQKEDFPITPQVVEQIAHYLF